jgi:hypothetical protein
VKCEVIGLPPIGEYSSTGSRISGEWAYYHDALTSNRIWLGSTLNKLYSILTTPKSLPDNKLDAIECGTLSEVDESMVQVETCNIVKGIPAYHTLHSFRFATRVTGNRQGFDVEVSGKGNLLIEIKLGNSTNLSFTFVQ